MHSDIVLLPQVKPDPLKRQLIPELAGILRKSGIPIFNISYGVEDLIEYFTVRMRAGAERKINVTGDSPITAAVKVLQSVQNH